MIRIVRAGTLDDDLMNLIVHNTREPEERLLDLKVQIGTNERGAVAVRELVEQMGFDAVQNAIEDILAYTARRLRNRVRELKPGSYSYTGYLDDDGSGATDPVADQGAPCTSKARISTSISPAPARRRRAPSTSRSARSKRSSITP